MNNIQGFKPFIYPVEDVAQAAQRWTKGLSSGWPIQNVFLDFKKAII